MIPIGARFTIGEIAEASGLGRKSLYYRYRRLVQTGQMPDGIKEFDYELAKALIRYKPRAKRADPAKVNILKRQLIDDGMARK